MKDQNVCESIKRLDQANHLVLLGTQSGNAKPSMCMSEAKPSRIWDCGGACDFWMALVLSTMFDLMYCQKLMICRIQTSQRA